MTGPRKIKVLVVEDSAVIRHLLGHILDADDAIQVVGYAGDGIEAMSQLEALRPDVITMDINMPRIDGYEAARRIMETQPVPIVIVSSVHQVGDRTGAFRAMEAGAVAAVEKPPGPGAVGHAILAHQLVQVVKAMAEVKVVTRWAHARHAVREREPYIPARQWLESLSPDRPVGVVAVGASTGGPPALRTLLRALPKPFPAPVLIVQHISAGFVQGLAHWLEQETGLPVRVAQSGECLQPGQVYLAPDGSHMTVSASGHILCRADEPESGLRPAISRLFRSVAQSCGKAAAGVLLTGMGRDGAEGLKRMREQGALTIAQDLESSVVHGMPGAAIELGAARYVLAPEQIGVLLGHWEAVRRGGVEKKAVE